MEVRLVQVRQGKFIFQRIQFDLLYIAARYNLTFCILQQGERGVCGGELRLCHRFIHRCPRLGPTLS